LIPGILLRPYRSPRSPAASSFFSDGDVSVTHQFTLLQGRLKDLPRLRFHDIRHTHATQLLAGGIHPKVAQERLGHSTINTTMDLYSHVTDTMQADAATRLDAAFQAAKVGRKSQS